MRFQSTKSLEERFWEKVDKGPDCWLWTSALTAGGYGTFTVMEDGKRKSVRAHRMAYELAIGPIPDGALLDHICLVHACVNPGHLRPVTQKQNQENRSGICSTSRSGVRGVSWNSSFSKWQVAVRHNGRRHNVGRFKDLEEAKAAAIAKRNELYTHNDRDRIAE